MKGCDGRNFFCSEIKFWHALVGAAVLDNGSDQLTLLIVQNKLTANQIGAAFAPASIGAMAKTAIRTKDLAAMHNVGRVGRRPLRISRRRGHTSGGGAPGACTGGGGLVV